MRGDAIPFFQFAFLPPLVFRIFLCIPLDPISPAVIWRNAVDSLTAAHKYYLYTPAPDSPEMADILANDLLTPYVSSLCVFLECH